MRRPLGLSRQLILALVLPSLIVLGGVAYFAEFALRQALEDSLGARLCAIAYAASNLVGDGVLYLQPGEEEFRASVAAKKKLDQLLSDTGAERGLVIDPSGKTLVDSKGALQIGDEYVRAQLDRLELERVATGQGAPSVLFKGPEGRWYKSCYAPLTKRNEPDVVRGAVVIQGAAGFFEIIEEMRRSLITIMVVGFFALVGLAALSARRVTVPLLKLSGAAERIGRGELTTRIPVGGPQEAQILSETMKKMASSLAERDEEMQVMLGGIAHEVRNPLGGIELFGGLLKEDLEPDDPRQKHVDKILSEIQVLAGVVNDFLAFARKHALDRAPTNLRMMVEELLANCETMAAEKKIEIRRDIAPELNAQLDEAELRRALLNLVQNAIQATPEDGWVEISIERQSDTVVFNIKDSGPGIPEDKRDEIFKPFFTTKQRGTGLGLALVKKSIEAHGGKIELLDRAGGAHFEIRLPFVEATAAPRPSSKSSLANEPGLINDDEEAGLIFDDDDEGLIDDG